jgi:non-reducing end alpha-L-arabinofuranosidase
MKSRSNLVMMLGLALILVGGVLMTAQQSGVGVSGAALQRPQGPCDVYATAGTPCVAAHSSTRALYASYNGPLYQVLRQSDGKTLDIGVVQPVASDAGGFVAGASGGSFGASALQMSWV